MRVDLIPTHALSPDGTRLVFYAADQSGKGALWLRALDSFEARSCRKLRTAFSRSGRPIVGSIAFFAGRRLYKFDLAARRALAKSAPSLEIRAAEHGARPAASSSRRVIHQRSCRACPRTVESRRPIAIAASPSYLPPVRGLRFFLTVARFLVLGALEKRNPSAACILASKSGQKMRGRRLLSSDTQAVLRRARVSAVWTGYASLPSAVRCPRRSKCLASRFPSSIACACLRIL